MTIQLTFLGAARSVTGSKYLISHAGKKILVDCGLFQGHKELRLRNWEPLPIDPRSIDAVLLTHAHIDHSGYLPLLVKNGFCGKIYSTQATRDLCAILLPDSGYLQEEDAKRANKYHYSKHHPALPLYTHDEAKKALNHFETLSFNQPLSLFNDFQCTFYGAGHILGASMIKVSCSGKSILFTGDLGRQNDPIMHPPAFIDSTDYLVTESTYGDRLHPETDPLEEFSEVIKKTVGRGGSVLIPAFTVGRAQEVLYYLYHLKEAHKIPDAPIFLDSPMAINASELLIRYNSEHRLSKDLSQKICHGARYVHTPEESKALDQLHMPSVIISASGMLEGGRILHHLKTFLKSPLNTIFLTGYQDQGTRGDRLLRGETELKIHGEMIPVKAEIASISSMSAHADYSEILAWLKHFKHPPQQTFITHGSLASAEALQAHIETQLGWKCVVPRYLETVEL